MDKLLRIISRHLEIFFIITRLCKRKTDVGIGGENRQSSDPEVNPKSENDMETRLGENKAQLIDLKKELKESIGAFIDKLFDRISGFLEEEYKGDLAGLKDEFIELKSRVKDLESAKEKGRSPVLDFIPYEEESLFSIDLDVELENDLNSENISANLKNVFKTKKGITLSENAYLAKEGDNRWKITDNERIYIIKKEDKTLNIYTGKLNIIEVVNALKSNFEDITKDQLEKIKIITGMATLLSADEAEIIKKPPQLDKNLRLDEFLADVFCYASETKERFQDFIKIPLLYNKGVALLNKGEEWAYIEAKKCFEEVVTINPNLRGAWLNRGVALGELGEIVDEIVCYEKALYLNRNYKKALRNMKIAKKEKKRHERN
jgi:tetratricopeptide (TPR) repeat protein